MFVFRTSFISCRKLRSPYLGKATAAATAALPSPNSACRIFVRSGLAKTILQGTVKGGGRQGRQRMMWEDNVGEWTGLEFAKSQRALENREKMEETGDEIICGAPVTLVVKE